MAEIRATTPADLRKRFENFILEREAVLGGWESVGPEGIYKPHLGIRPCEFLLQHKFAAFPLLPAVRHWLREADDSFGPSVDALLLGMWVDACAGKWRSRPGVADALELCVIDRRPADIGAAVTAVIRHVLDEAHGEVPVVNPAANACINLAAGNFATLTDTGVLSAIVAIFDKFSRDREVLLNPNLMAVGSLLWRALDAGVIDADKLRQILKQKPMLFRALESDFFQAGLRISAAVPENSPSERLVETLCLDQLDNLTHAPELHTWGGPIKSIPLWPGREVFRRTLLRLEESRQIAKNEFQDTLSSSLWHILRHTRPRTGEGLSKRDFADVGERTLIWAASVAPWWAEEIEKAKGWHGFADLIAWTVAHPEAAMSSSDRTHELPRIDRQLAALVRNRGVHRHTDRQSGIFEREWLLAAVDELGDERASGIIQAMHLAWKHRTYLTEAAQAILGQNAEHIWSGAQEHRQLFVKMLGLLPDHGDVASRLDWFRDFWTAQEQVNQQRRLIERRAALVGAANLAETTHAGNSVLLALENGRASVEPDVLPLPVEFDKHRLDLDTDETGGLRPMVVRYGKRERSLRGVPREIAERKEFRTMRQAMRELSHYDEALRGFLESRMLQGRAITGEQLRLLMQHPIGRERAHRFVFMMAEPNAGATAIVEGMPVRDPDTHAVHLETREGDLLELSPTARITLAHPLDLQAHGTLDAWRDTVVKRRLFQPFAQLFRLIESPGMSATERGTRAYAGKAVDAMGAIDQLRGSGWEVGIGQPPRRMFRDAGVVAHWPFTHCAPDDVLQSSRAITGELFFTEFDSDVRVAVDSISRAIISDTGRDCANVIADCSLDREAVPTSILDMRREVVQRLIVLHAQVVEASRVEASVSNHRLSVRIFVEELGAARAKKKKSASGADATPEPKGRWVVVHVDLKDASLSVGPKRVAVPKLPEPDVPMFVPDPPSPTMAQIADLHARLVHSGNFERRALMEFLREHMPA